MSDSNKSQAKHSGNTAEVLSQFHEQRAQRDKNRVEVSAVYSMCFIYHPEGCDHCSSYLEHLLEDIKRRPSTFAFTKDEILDGLNEVWPHIGKYIQNLDVSRATFEKELYEETADNCQLHEENEDMRVQIIILETRLESLQPPALSERIMTPPPTTESPTDSYPLTSLVKAQYSRKHAHKLDENEDFQNKVRKYDSRPDHWSLHMWQALVGWHRNPMSVPNVLRENSDGYFLEEDVDVAAWLNKVIGELPCQAIMLRMKDVFGSHINFETVFSGFDPNLLCAEMHLLHCALVPKSLRESKEKAPYKGKKPVTGAGQPKSSVHTPTPAKTGESSQQQLDADLESYGQVHKQVLPYGEAPPSGEPESGETAPLSGGATSTLHDESTMDIDQIVEDIYRDC
ncbi:hypothetical protein M422DRAFT_240855 [Sphaerobolus stellatus SS14]|nr:hypothetical protein M422DRAFT_240855 [Sphaerobolus stellatus SS14]